VFEIRLHGRGGQGVVSASELLALAAFSEGREAQAFPSFGPERTGAPVAAFCRVDTRPIRTHEPVVEPDAVIVLDPTLLHHVDVFGGAGPEAYAVVNSSRTASELGLAHSPLSSLLHPHRIAVLPATELGQQHLGRPLPSAALLGAFAALTGVVSLAAILVAVRERFAGPLGEGNAAAAAAGFALVDETREPPPLLFPATAPAP
jgi:pyruvate ferredoxin oxidoreductase gamma subunit